jgi:hypothetical protein
MINASLTLITATVLVLVHQPILMNDSTKPYVALILFENRRVLIAVLNFQMIP